MIDLEDVFASDDEQQDSFYGFNDSELPSVDSTTSESGLPAYVPANGITTARWGHLRGHSIHEALSPIYTKVVNWTWCLQDFHNSNCSTFKDI